VPAAPAPRRHRFAPTRCPRCAAPLPDDHDWCLECGAAARTRLAPPPNWRIPVAIVAAVIVLSLAGLAFAFFTLSGGGDDAVVTTPPATTAAPATQP
jgi:hypothetical protein